MGGNTQYWETLGFTISGSIRVPFLELLSGHTPQGVFPVSVNWYFLMLIPYTCAQRPTPVLLHATNNQKTWYMWYSYSHLVKVSIPVLQCDNIRHFFTHIILYMPVNSIKDTITIWYTYSGIFSLCYSTLHRQWKHVVKAALTVMLAQVWNWVGYCISGGYLLPLYVAAKVVAACIKCVLYSRLLCCWPLDHEARCRCEAGYCFRLSVGVITLKRPHPCSTAYAVVLPCKSQTD